MSGVSNLEELAQFKKMEANHLDIVRILGKIMDKSLQEGSEERWVDASMKMDDEEDRWEQTVKGHLYFVERYSRESDDGELPNLPFQVTEKELDSYDRP